MATIDSKSLFFEIFPRKYAERDEDPFIASNLVLKLNDKTVFHFYGELLMKSEYEYILDNVKRILNGEMDEFILKPVEPIFEIQIVREDSEHYCWVFKFHTERFREYSFYTGIEEVEKFYMQLNEEMDNILPPPFLP